MNTAVAIALEPEVYRWKRNDFRSFLGSGVMEDPSRFELLDGLILSLISRLRVLATSYRRLTSGY